MTEYVLLLNLTDTTIYSDSPTTTVELVILVATTVLTSVNSGTLDVIHRSLVLLEIHIGQNYNVWNNDSNPISDCKLQMYMGSTEFF